MMRQTGGIALGETSTRSSPFSSARRSASCVGSTPSWLPSSPTTRTSGTRMRRLTRYESCGGGPEGGLEMVVLLLLLLCNGRAAAGDLGFPLQPGDEGVER